MCMNLEQEIYVQICDHLLHIYSCIEHMHMYLVLEREAICNELLNTGNNSCVSCSGWRWRGEKLFLCLDVLVHRDL